MQPLPDLAGLAGARYVSLTTFRKSGEPVSTPVWIAPDAHDRAILYVLTMLGAGKLKRIRNNSAVELAPCDMRGRILGPALPATCRILPPADHAVANRALTRKYGIQKRALDLLHFLQRGRRAYLAIESRTVTARPGRRAG